MWDLCMVISPEIGTYHSDVHVSLSETFLKKKKTRQLRLRHVVSKKEKKGIKAKAGLES